MILDKCSKKAGQALVGRDEDSSVDIYWGRVYDFKRSVVVQYVGYTWRLLLLSIQLFRRYVFFPQRVFYAL